MAILKVIKGQEFKVRVEENISDSIFKDEYNRANQMLDIILGAVDNKKTVEFEYENNIIAFCGGRGDGKTSAMLTFMKAHENKFVKQIVIDPSLFDDVHNILDIVLAEIFNDFKDIYENDNQKIENRDKEELLRKFESVYKQLSLINNKTKILDSEYDYEGDIGKLSKLGESTKLKKNLIKLIQSYLKMKASFEENNDSNCDNAKCKSIIIGIDDLDLCSQNAYRMAEQIRKYLIIPNVVIVMAIRVDQLELCVREKNIGDFEKNLKYITSDDNSLQVEMTTMARKYVEKLIPPDRRIYLTQKYELTNLEILFEENENYERGQNVFELIYDKTGVVFRPNANGTSFLLPENLRGIVSLVALLRDMKNDSKVKNIDLLRSYFMHEWQPVANSNVIDFEEIYYTNLFEKNAYVYNVLSEYAGIESRVNIDERLDLSYAVKWFVYFANTPFEKKKKENVYRVRALYSLILNRLLVEGKDDEINHFINGFVWKDAFDNVIPVTIVDNTTYKRVRFDIPIDIAYRTMLTCLTTKIEEYDSLEEDENDYYEIIETEYAGSYKPVLGNKFFNTEQQDYVEMWLLLGLFLNTRNSNGDFVNGKLIFDNGMYWGNCQASIENYIVGLANLDLVYDKINAVTLIADESELIDMLKLIRESNEDTIRCAKIIVSNMDIIIGIMKYCEKRNYYDNLSSDAFFRTLRTYELFFDNMRTYLKNSGVNIGKCDFNTLYIPLEEKLEIKELNVSYILAQLFDDSIYKDNIIIEEKKKSLLQRFEQLLYGKGNQLPNVHNGIIVIPRSNKANTMRRNLETIAKVIQIYRMKYYELPGNIPLKDIYDLYKEVLDRCFGSQETVLSQDMIDRYIKLAGLVKKYEDIK